MIADGPLAHLRVLDATDIRGALAGRILADLGADVLKIEGPGGDPGRRRGPFAGGSAEVDRSLAFLFRNANKRGRRIDLASAGGRREFEELLSGADILVENFGRREATRLGLAPAETSRAHPRLIHVSIADYGLDGPHADRRLEALPAFAASGALWACGFSDLPPCSVPGYLAHDCASVFALCGVLGAVLERAASGVGQHVEVSVQEAALNGLHPWPIPVVDYAARWPMLPKVGRRNADGAYYVLGTADGFVRVLPSSPRQWRGFLELIGSPEALCGPEFELPLVRLANTDVVRVLAEDALRERRRADVLRDGWRLGVPITPLNTPGEFVREEQTRVRGFFLRTGFPHLDGAPFAPLAFNFSKTPVSVRCPAPTPDDRSGWAVPPQSAAPERSGGSTPRRALEGVRVVDLGVGVAIPEAGWILAELGADVIKVESRANVDFLRRVTVEPGQVNQSWTFNDASRGHRSVCLDLETERGRALALDLCAVADVVLENNRGGVARSWGLDYDDVRRRRADVIYLASQGYGRGGPLGELAAYGPLNSAFAGVNFLWNHPGVSYPAGASLNHPDHVAAKLAVVAVLSALEHRRRTGEGQYIETSQAETAAFLMGEFYLEEPCTGVAPQPAGNGAPWASPHGVYPAAGEDRWVAIAVVSDAEWESLVGIAAFPSEPRWTTSAGRVAARDEVDALVAAWTRSQEPFALAARLQEAGISASVVLHGVDLRSDPHLAQRGALPTVTHPEMGPTRHSGSAVRLSRTPLTPATAAPCLGADTAAVLTDLLHLSTEEVEALTREGTCR